MVRVAVLLVIATLLASVAAAQDPNDARATAAYRRIIPSVTVEALQRDSQAIAAIGSRLAGSDGERRALEWMESRFRELGFVNVRRQRFEVTVPDPAARATLQVGAKTFELYPMWPNLIRTSTCDVTGKLIDGGDGSLAALSGKNLRGAVVLLEFDSQGNWKNAFKFGAGAVVFLEPEATSRYEAEQKFSSAPLSAPRFWAPRELSADLIATAKRQAEVRLVCRQDWVVRETYNLFADAAGGGDARLERERLVWMAPADAMSVVPGLAPGGSGTASLVALLELARQHVRVPGRRPATFAVMAANGLGLQGWREYTEDLVRQNKESFLHLTLDLNDGSPTMGAYARAWFYEYRNEPLDRVRNLTRTFREHGNRIAPLVGAAGGRFVVFDTANESDGKSWRNTVFGKFAFGCEPMLLAGVNAVTFATAENSRPRIDTPGDTVQSLDFERIRRQVQALACLQWHVARDTSDLGELSAHKVPVSPSRPSRMSLVGGYATLEGQIAQYDPNKSFIADIGVPGGLAVLEHQQKTLGGVRAPLIQKSDQNGKFRFLGLAPLPAYFHLDHRPTLVAGYAVDPASGRVSMAPSEGLFGHIYDRGFMLKVSYRHIPIVVFPAASVDLYGIVDPHELKPLDYYRVMDPVADAEPKNFSLARPTLDMRLNSDQEDVAVLFVEAGARYSLLMGSGLGDSRLVLTNSTRKEPNGAGYRGPTEHELFENLSLRTARDLIQINENRLAKFRKYRILSPELESLQREARSAADEAERAAQRMQWDAYDRSARAAWGYALRAHPMIMGTVNDVVTGVIFYLVLLVPFSYFIERLFFAHRTLTKQLLTSIAIFIGAFVVLHAIHPAFEIVSNPSMIFVAFVMGALSLLVAGFIVGKFETSLRDMRAKRTGLGHIDVGRMSVAMAAFNLGISNMRRRKARTFLTTLTLVVMTFIVLSFTSIVPEVEVAESATGREGAYPGLLVRDPGLEPLQSTALRAVRNEFRDRATIAARAWFYGADQADHGVLTVANGELSADVRAVAGFEPSESSVSHPQAALAKGRWFRPGERDVILLPSSIATKLEADVGDPVVFGGSRLQVIGIVDDAEAPKWLDLDGESVLPADFSLSERRQAASRSANQAFRRFLRMDPGTCLFVPLELCLAAGGELRTIAVRFADPKAVRSALEALMPRLRMNLYGAVPSGEGLKVSQFSVLQSSQGTGFGLVIVQMLIASVFVLNTMVASVYERRREIGIFSSIGLAPSHVSVLFFAESCVYGVLGAVAGYFLAQGVAKVITVANLAPGLYLNFSAMSAVLAAGIVLGVVLLSTIYPSRIAERIAAPAYENEIDSVPEGDRWQILLPFRVSTDEAEPLMRFFDEWFRGYEEYAVGEFVTSDTQLSSSADGWRLATTAWLSPFDLGVSQKVVMKTRPAAAPGVVEVTLTLERLSGEPRNWENVNKRFFVGIRRHFLAWRTKPKA